MDTFMDLIVTKLLPDTYQVNSYLQEHLVDIYSTLDEMKRASQSEYSVGLVGKAAILFYRFVRFGPRVETTLQRGNIHFGFIRSRILRHSHVITLFTWLWSKIYITRTSVGSLPKSIDAAKKAAGGVLKPITSENAQILAQMIDVSKSYGKNVLQREIQDVRLHGTSTRESHITSVLILASLASFFGAIISTISNFGVWTDLYQFDELSSTGRFIFGAVTPLSAVMSFFFLARKFVHLVGVGSALRPRAGDCPQTNRVLFLTRTQQVITTMRIVASVGTAISLPWGLVVLEHEAFAIEPPERFVPIYIAVSSLGLHLFSKLYQFYVEYTQRYQLDPKLGEFVCGGFLDEIEKTRASFALPINDIETRQVQERRLWEYTAREFLHNYRFDTVFAANRFGNILQYLQSGINRYSEIQGV
jgi:hypothetical protein